MLICFQPRSIPFNRDARECKRHLDASTPLQEGAARGSALKRGRLLPKAEI